MPELRLDCAKIAKNDKTPFQCRVFPSLFIAGILHILTFNTEYIIINNINRPPDTDSILLDVIDVMTGLLRGKLRFSK